MRYLKSRTVSDRAQLAAGTRLCPHRWVPPLAGGWERRLAMIKRLLGPLDSSAQAEEAHVGPALLARRCEAEVVLVRVTPQGAMEFFGGEEYHTSSAKERAYVDQRADRLCQEGFG